MLCMHGANTEAPLFENPEITDNIVCLNTSYNSLFQRKNSRAFPTKQELFHIIDEILYNLHLPTYFEGYYYIKSAIYLTILSEKWLPDEHSKILTKISDEYGADRRHIERAMTKAVNFINNICDRNYIMHIIAGYEAGINNLPLNTKELVALAADQLKIKYFE